MAELRVESLRELLIQTRFSPESQRLAQMEACENLLAMLEPAQAYPFEFVCYRLTGYRPRAKNADKIISYNDLIHDLPIYVEQLSRSVKLTLSNMTGKFYTAGQLGRRFHVCKKTISRWRSDGLIARHVLFDDGRCRLVFSATAVDVFLRRQRQRVKKSAKFSQINKFERNAIIRRLLRWAHYCPDRRQEAINRTARKFARSRESIRAILNQLEQQVFAQGSVVKPPAFTPLANPAVGALFIKRAAAMDTAELRAIAQQYDKGVSVEELTLRFDRSRSNIYRAITLARAAELRGLLIHYIPSPEFTAEGDKQHLLTPADALFPTATLFPAASLFPATTLITAAMDQHSPEALLAEEKIALALTDNSQPTKAPGDSGEWLIVGRDITAEPALGAPPTAAAPREAVQEPDEMENLLENQAEMAVPERGAPGSLAAYMGDIGEAKVLSAPQEAFLFRKYNYLKFLAARVQEGLSPDNPRGRAMRTLRAYLREAEGIKDVLVRSNLRLVVSVARKHTRSEAEMPELISEGNVALLNAVEKFDFGRGFKFSTYATWAIVKRLATLRREAYKQTAQPATEEVLEVAQNLRVEDSRVTAVESARRSLEEVIAEILEERERVVVREHYGLHGGKTILPRKPKSLSQIAELLGLSKERVRQIELISLQKLRRALSGDQFDLLTQS